MYCRAWLPLKQAEDTLSCVLNWCLFWMSINIVYGVRSECTAADSQSHASSACIQNARRFFVCIQMLQNLGAHVICTLMISSSRVSPPCIGSARRWNCVTDYLFPHRLHAQCTAVKPEKEKPSPCILNARRWFLNLRLHCRAFKMHADISISFMYYRILVCIWNASWWFLLLWFQCLPIPISPRTPDARRCNLRNE